MADELHDPNSVGNYVRGLIAKSGKSIAKIAHAADTSPAVLDSVLTGRRKLGIDLAVRLARALDVDLIEFLTNTRILPANTTNQRSALEYTLLGVFDEMSPENQKQLIGIAKAIFRNG